MGKVSIRIKSLSQPQAIGQIKHDIRVNQPTYIRNKEKDNFLLFDGNTIRQNDNDENKINILYDELKKKNSQSRKEHIKISEEKTKRQFQKTTKSAIS